MISVSPKPSRGVMLSPKTSTPMQTAVTGSKAPRMAVGVEPMYWMALVVHRNEMAVGNTASPKRQPHRYQRSGTLQPPPISRRTTNKRMPNSRT